MPSAFTHVVAGACIASLITPRRRYVIAAALCSALPDVDSLGFWLGIPYAHMLGHRGLTHSVAFAVALAGMTAWLLKRSDRSDVSLSRLSFSLFLATVSHGLLDALTNGGLGIAFFAPFSDERYFLPWRPIIVSPISITRFFSPRAFRILTSEFLVVWVPALTLWLIGALWRRAYSR